MKIKVKEQIMEVPSWMRVAHNKLYNDNTKRYEGVEGDIVTMKIDGEYTRGHVKGYTDFQVIPTHEWATMIVPAQGLYSGKCTISFTHQTLIEEIMEEQL